MTDLELMQALERGDPEAMRLLVDRFGRRIFKYLYGWARNREDALDLTQEVLMRIHQKAHLYNPKAPLAPWIFRIAHNIFHDHLRKKNYKVHAASVELKEQWVSPPAGFRPNYPERAARRNEAMLKVQEAVEQLPRRQRQVVQLRLLSGLKLEEIAQALGISLGAVKSTLHTAIRRLREALSELEGEVT
ncbi:MAG TPA: RNA polymerase sigma factor [Acidobacteriota bacterium]|nr:RNA polymerase sigma factor [Acidobacteriota bacterium]